MVYKFPLLMSPQPEVGFTVTSPLLPELVTEGDTVDEALANARDALAAVIEAYEVLGRSLPANTKLPDSNSPLWIDTVVTMSRRIGKRRGNRKSWAAKSCHAAFRFAMEMVQSRDAARYNLVRQRHLGLNRSAP